MWWFFIGLVVSFVASYAMMPKPQVQSPPAIGEVKAPTAEEGREIPVLFGTRVLEGPNVLWYGDIRTKPVKKKQSKK